MLAKIKELFSGFHGFSITIPIISKINWATAMQTRVFIDFTCFILLLWVVFCPDQILGGPTTVSEKSAIVVSMIVYLLDTVLAFFCVETLYTNLVSLIINPLMLILTLVQHLSDEISIIGCTVCLTLAFAASVIHVVIIYFFKVNDIQIDAQK